MQSLPELLEEDDEPERAESGGSDDKGESEEASASSLPDRSDSLLQQAPVGGTDAASAADAGGGKGQRRAAAAAAAAAASCALCGKAAARTWVQCTCGCRTHVECLARHFLVANTCQRGLPGRGACPGCARPLGWGQVLASVQNVGWENKQRRKGRRRGAAPTDPSTQQQQRQQAVPGSPSESRAPAQQRKRRPKKAAAEVEVAVVEAAPAVPAASRPHGRPRRQQQQPLASLFRNDPGSMASAHSSDDLDASLQLDGLEAGAPWEDFNGGPQHPSYFPCDSSPLSSSCGSPTAQQLQQQQDQHECGSCDARHPWREHSTIVIALDSSSGSSQVVSPVNRQHGDYRGSSAQQQHQQHQQQAVDLTSPSPVPLLERLRQGRGREGATPSPPPRRRSRSHAADQAAAAGVTTVTAAAADCRLQHNSDIVVLTSEERV